MKLTPLLLITFYTLLAACNTEGNSRTKAGDPALTKLTKDTSITVANAYNYLFLDSTALEIFIARENLPDSIATPMRAFYFGRNFEFAWFATDGLSEQGRGFWNLASYSLTTLKDSSAFSKALNKRMPNITSNDTLAITPTDTGFITTELMLTEAWINYLHQNGSIISIEQLQKCIPVKKQNTLQLADAFAKTDNAPSLNKDAGDAYKLLNNQLKLYYGVAKKGGWQSIAFTGQKFTLGVNAPVVALVKKRLQTVGLFAGSDTTTMYGSNLDTAIKSLQANLGYTPNGIINDSLLKDLNIPVEKRLQQLLVNLNRLFWMPELVPGKLIVTNIPEYVLHVYNDKKKVFEMDVVVGKDGAGTVIFTGNLTEIVFSPYWNIPPSITKREIVPKMKGDKGYLARQRLQVTGYSNGLPIVRQLPGPKNSLGRVKFLFHNSYNIYFHDTPQKSLFNKDKRAYSHGCIRIANPVKMADYLLEDSQKWTPEKITEAMNSGKEKYVSLKHGVPVIIDYYTAWVDETGQLNLRDDIYAHDAETARKMFTDFQ